MSILGNKTPIKGKVRVLYIVLFCAIVAIAIIWFAMKKMHENDKLYSYNLYAIEQAGQVTTVEEINKENTDNKELNIIITFYSDGTVEMSGISGKIDDKGEWGYSGKQMVIRLKSDSKWVKEWHCEEDDTYFRMTPIVVETESTSLDTYTYIFKK